MKYTNLRKKLADEIIVVRLPESRPRESYYCVLRAFIVDSRGQTYVFKPKIALGIQIWVQNNQLSWVPSTDFFKKLFWAQKIVEKNREFC